MTPHVLDIPDDEASLPAWLERHVVGPDLAEFVAELVAVHVDAPYVSLDESLDGRTGEVLAAGIGVVGTDGCAALLRSPLCLFELQERVLVEGGRHWDDIAADHPTTGQLVEAAWPPVRSAIDEGRPTETRGDDDVPETPPASESRRSSHWRTAGLASLLTAAAMLMAMLAWPEFGPQPAPVKPGGWGWSRAGALTKAGTPREYLAGLADSAEEWFKKRPETARDVATRIAQFRQGCSTLILADHAPLAEADRVWLRGRCRVWAAKLDHHLTEVEAGADPLEIRATADETIQKLIDALRTRSEAV